MAAMLAPTTTQRNSQKRGRPDADRRNPLDRINNNAYRGAANMAMQESDLDDISDYNALEDVSRAKLGQILREQERVLSKMGAAGSLALDLNRRAQRALSAVDVLDAIQGLDKKDQPVKRARHWNRDTADACKEIIRDSEPKSTSRPDNGLAA